MGESMFTSLSSQKIATLVGQASHRVLIAAPGVRDVVAQALLEYSRRRGVSAPVVILDCNDDVCRHGFGQATAIRTMIDGGIEVRQCAGLRIGVLVCDDDGWSFAPVPLSIEDEPQTDETPNAIGLTLDQAAELVRAAAPSLIVPADLWHAVSADPTVRAEIGTARVTPAELESVEESLKIAPPASFDLQRQVQVFQPYIQYVELNLTGCSIRRHTVQLPQEMMSLATDRSVQERLRTTFSLISTDSELSDKALQDELEEIRKIYTRALGKPWGRMMLKSKRPELDHRVAALRDRVTEFGCKVKARLVEEMDWSLAHLVDAFLPLVTRNPPEHLLAQIQAPRPTSDQAAQWLDVVLREAFPKPEQVVQSMRLECIYKDVTYDSLNQEGLRQALEQAYPYVAWGKPFTEFNAARERERQAAP